MAGSPPRVAHRAPPTRSDRVTPARHHAAGWAGGTSISVGAAPRSVSRSGAQRHRPGSARRSWAALGRGLDIELERTNGIGLRRQSPCRLGSAIAPALKSPADSKYRPMSRPRPACGGIRAPRCIFASSAANFGPGKVRAQRPCQAGADSTEVVDKEVQNLSDGTGWPMRWQTTGHAEGRSAVRQGTTPERARESSTCRLSSASPRAPAARSAMPTPMDEVLELAKGAPPGRYRIEKIYARSRHGGPPVLEMGDDHSRTAGESIKVELPPWID